VDSTGKSEGYEFNLEEYWHVIVRRRWLVLFSAVMLGLFSWLFTGLHQPPPVYSSSTQVKIERSTSMTGLMMQGMMYDSVNHIRTQMVVIRSYALLERVAKHLGMISEKYTSEEVRTHPEMMSQILRLRSSVEVEQEGESGVITITTTGDTPEVARDLARAVAEEYRKYNIEDKNQRVFEARQFIQNQLTVVGKRLQDAEKEMQDYQQSHRAAMDPSEAARISGKVHGFEEKQIQQEDQLHELTSLAGKLKQRIGPNGWDFNAISVDIKVSDTYTQLSQQLSAMAFKHTQLSADYTDEHPAMKALRQQGNEIVRAMTAEVARQIVVVQSNLKEIAKALQVANQAYQQLPKEVIELTRLQRNVKVTAGLFNELQSKYQEAQIKEAEKVSEVTIIKPASLSQGRINPANTRKSAVAGTILGLVLGLIIALILEALDTSVGSIEEVEHFLDVPVVGFIPQLSHDMAQELFVRKSTPSLDESEMNRRIRLVSHFSSNSTFSEAYRAMRANLMFSQTGEHQVLLVTSSTIKEGKSTVSANLAVVVAQQGSRVLLIDADLRKPMQHRTFGVNREPGLTSFLLGQKDWHDCVQRVSDMMLGDFGVDEVLITPGLDQLDLLVCGSKTSNPTDLLTSPPMEQLIQEAREEYDMIIIDMPPLLHTADATMVASKVDGILLVYHIGAVARAVLRRVKTNIEAVGGKVAGVVINGVRGELSRDFANLKMDKYGAYAYGEPEKQSRTEAINAWFTDLGSRVLRWFRSDKRKQVLIIVAVAVLGALFLVTVNSIMREKAKGPMKIQLQLSPGELPTKLPSNLLQKFRK